MSFKKLFYEMKEYGETGTTSEDMNHTHTYTVDSAGNGVTSEDAGHVHFINDWFVQADGLIPHIHELQEEKPIQYHKDMGHVQTYKDIDESEKIKYDDNGDEIEDVDDEKEGDSEEIE